MNLAQLWQSMIVCGPPNLPDCDFNSLIKLTKVLINNLIVLSTLLATVAFIWVGFVLLTSQGDPGAMSKAKHAAGSVVKGYIFILAAWLIVYTITSVLLKDGYSILGSPR